MKLTKQAFSDFKQEVKRSAIRMFADANPSDEMLDTAMQNMGIEVESEIENKVQEAKSAADSINAEIDAVIAEFEQAKAMPDVEESNIKGIDSMLEQLKNFKEEIAVKLADVDAARKEFIKAEAAPMVEPVATV